MLWAAPILTAKGELAGVTAIFEDITERIQIQGKLHASEERQQKMQAQLQHHEERIQLAFDASGAAFWDWNVVSDEQVWSANAKKLMGLPTSPNKLSQLYERVHPDDREHMGRGIDKALRERAPHMLLSFELSGLMRARIGC